MHVNGILIAQQKHSYTKILVLIVQHKYLKKCNTLYGNNKKHIG